MAAAVAAAAGGTGAADEAEVGPHQRSSRRPPHVDPALPQMLLFCHLHTTNRADPTTAQVTELAFLAVHLTDAAEPAREFCSVVRAAPPSGAGPAAPPLPRSRRESDGEDEDGEGEEGDGLWREGGEESPPPRSVAEAEDGCVHFLFKILVEIQGIAKHLDGRNSFLLCGDDASFDRLCLAHHMPRLTHFLHFRTLNMGNVLTFFQWFRPDVARQRPRPSVYRTRALVGVYDTWKLFRFFRTYFAANAGFKPAPPPPPPPAPVPVPVGGAGGAGVLSASPAVAPPTPPPLLPPASESKGADAASAPVASEAKATRGFGAGAGSGRMPRGRGAQRGRKVHLAVLHAEQPPSPPAAGAGAEAGDEPLVLLLGCDMEATQKNPATALPLEVALRVTDVEGRREPRTFHVVIHWPSDVLAAALSTWSTENLGPLLIKEIQTSTTSVREADAQCRAFLDEIAADVRRDAGRGVRFLICGSNVGFDRECIRRWFPDVYRLLSPDIFDVTSLLLFWTWYRPDLSPEKPRRSTMRHRASEDILDSLGLFRFYQHTLLARFAPAAAPAAQPRL